MSTNEVREAMIEWRDGGEDRFLYVVQSAGGLVLQSGPVRGERVTEEQIVLPPAARARLLALLAPEPEPSDADSAPDWAVKALGVDAWNAVKARYENCPDCIRDIQAAMPVPAWETAARGVVEAILRAGWNISPAPEPELSEREIEAAVALMKEEGFFERVPFATDADEDAHYRSRAEWALAAARAARQTGGA